MRAFNKIASLTLSILFSTLLFSKSPKQQNDSLSFKKDLINNQITFYLNDKNLVKDSLTLHNMNFRVDSLIKVQTLVWHYIYSVRCGSNCKLRNQIIIIADSGRLHLSYAGYFNSSYDLRELYSKTLNVNGSEGLQQPVYNCTYTFADNFFLGKPIIKEYLYKGKIQDQGKGNTLSYHLKYDSIQKVYYTQKQLLSGVYTFENKQGEAFKKKLNKVVSVLTFKENVWTFYNGDWYELDQKNYSLNKFD